MVPMHKLGPGYSQQTGKQLQMEAKATQGNKSASSGALYSTIWTVELNAQLDQSEPIPSVKKCHY